MLVWMDETPLDAGPPYLLKHTTPDACKAS